MGKLMKKVLTKKSARNTTALKTLLVSTAVVGSAWLN